MCDASNNLYSCTFTVCSSIFCLLPVVNRLNRVTKSAWCAHSSWPHRILVEEGGSVGKYPGAACSARHKNSLRGFFFLWGIIIITVVHTTWGFPGESTCLSLYYSLFQSLPGFLSSTSTKTCPNCSQICLYFWYNMLNKTNFYENNGTNTVKMFIRLPSSLEGSCLAVDYWYMRHTEVKKSFLIQLMMCISCVYTIACE